MPLFSQKPTEPGLDERLAKLERRFEEIEHEWSGWYDKYRRLYARLVKRDKDAEKEAEDRAEAANGTQARVTNPAALALLRGGNRGVLSG